MRILSGSPSAPASRRSRRAAVVAALLLLPAVGGCGASFGAQTEQRYQPAVGVSNRDGQVYSIQTLLVTDGQGNATLVAALIDQSRRPDALVGMTVRTTEGQQLRVSITPPHVALPSQRTVQLARTGPVRVFGSLVPGTYVTVAYMFAQSAPLTMQIPIVSRTGAFAHVPVGPPATPSMTPLTTSPAPTSPPNGVPSTRATPTSAPPSNQTSTGQPAASTPTSRRPSTPRRPARPSGPIVQRATNETPSPGGH